MALELSTTNGKETVATAPPSAPRPPTTGVVYPPPAAHSPFVWDRTGIIERGAIATGILGGAPFLASLAGRASPGVYAGILSAWASIAGTPFGITLQNNAANVAVYGGSAALMTGMTGGVLYLTRDSFWGATHELMTRVGSYFDRFNKNTQDTLNLGRDTFNKNTQDIKDAVRNAAGSLSSAITGAGGAIGGAGGSLASAAQSQLPLIVIVVLGGAYLRHRAS